MAKSKSAPNPAKSEGARMERKAFRAYLRRQIAAGPNRPEPLTLDDILEWVKTRQKRYDNAQGGLGKKGSK